MTLAYWRFSFSAFTLDVRRANEIISVLSRLYICPDIRNVKVRHHWGNLLIEAHCLVVVSLIEPFLHG